MLPNMVSTTLSRGSLPPVRQRAGRDMLHPLAHSMFDHTSRHVPRYTGYVPGLCFTRYSDHQNERKMVPLMNSGCPLQSTHNRHQEHLRNHVWCGDRNHARCITKSRAANACVLLAQGGYAEARMQ